VEEKRLLVDVTADGRHGLSGIEPVKDGIGKLMVIHHLLGVLFRVHRKRYQVGADLLEPLNVSLKVS
jgi:hypothetical protein